MPHILERFGGMSVTGPSAPSRGYIRRLFSTSIRLYASAKMGEESRFVLGGRKCHSYVQPKVPRSRMSTASKMMLGAMLAGRLLHKRKTAAAMMKTSSGMPIVGLAQGATRREVTPFH